VILVDAVVNEDGTMIQFLESLDRRRQRIRGVLMAGVVQAGAVPKLENAIAEVGLEVSLVALRLSEAKFAGRDGMNTGNRLFMTVDFER
jgi:hypothetical protein